MSMKLEINFNRLLNRCEKIAGDKSAWDWRFEKYIEALHEQLSEIRRATSKPSQDVLTEYSRRVEFLKGLLEAEKLPSLGEKWLAADRLAPVSHTQKTPGIAPTEVHQYTKSRLQKEMRSELFGDTTKSKHDTEIQDGVRHRKQHEDGDIDALIQHHHKVHERLAEELLHHTHNLKDFAYASSAIVKKDIEKVGDTNKLADKNYDSLQKESQRLEAKTKSCSWWIWIMLAVVTLVFLWMVVLMRLFPRS